MFEAAEVIHPVAGVLKAIKFVPEWTVHALVFVVAYAVSLYALAPDSKKHLVDAFQLPRPVVAKQVSAIMPALQNMPATSNAVSSVTQQVPAATATIPQESAVPEEVDPAVAHRESEEKERVARLVANSRSADALTRRSAVTNLAWASADEALPALSVALNDRNKSVKLAAIYALGEVDMNDANHARAAANALTSLLADADPAVVSAAQMSYQSIMETIRDRYSGQ